MGSFDLSLAWAAIICFAIFAYVVMDGFDLGVGILSPVLEPGKERDQAINSIAPFWDGNETWLVMGGGGLLAVFPLAYSIILPATYPLMIAMLLGLVFRGAAFEFRWRDPAHQPLWDLVITVGSTVAALAQGITIGAILQGIEVENNAYAGGWLDWLSPFSILTGIAVVIGYALLGATWLIRKTEGGCQRHAHRLAYWLGIATVLALVAVSAATPFLYTDYWHRWFEMPQVLWTAQVPLMVAICTGFFFWSLKKGHELLPFLMALALFLLGFIGLCISIFPNMIPPSVTLWEAAAPRDSQLFLLVGAVFIIPVILGYTGWAYWVFRGKVGTEGYH